MATTSPPCAGILSRTCNTLLFLGLVWMSNGATSAEGSALSRGSTPGKDYPIATPSRFARIERSPARPRCRNAASDPSTWTASAPVPDPAWPPKPMLYPRDPTLTPFGPERRARDAGGRFEQPTCHTPPASLPFMAGGGPCRDNDPRSSTHHPSSTPRGGLLSLH